MSTARSLTIVGGGVPARGYLPGRGVPAQGDTCPGGGCTCLGGTCREGACWGVPAQGVPAWGVPAWGRGVSCDLSHHAFDVTCMLPPLQLSVSTSAAAYIVWPRCMLGYTPSVTEWQTGAKILPCPKLRLRAVTTIIYKRSDWK